MIRRVIGTTLAGLCALAGPMAVSAQAADTPDALLTVSGSVRPGVSFTVNSDRGCGSEAGAATVDFSFTDSQEASFTIGSANVDEDGNWSPATVQLPVTGPDDSNAWQDAVASGAGHLDAECLTSDDSGGSGARSTGADDPIDPTELTTYASLPITLTGTAAQLTASPALVSAGGSSVTVTPTDACPGTGIADVAVSVVELSTGDDPVDGAGDGVNPPLATQPATTTADGKWAPVSLALPADADTGDYAVTATCSHDDGDVSSYDAKPLAIGTVTVGQPSCTTSGIKVTVSGTYTGDIAGATEDDDSLPLPAKMTHPGNGPWSLKISSATTGQVLLAQTLTCDLPPYKLNVLKTGVSAKGQIQAKVCNVGRGPVTAILQTVKGQHAVTIDQESLASTACTVLSGGQVRRGADAKAQVLLDPPGSSTEPKLVQKFTVHRNKH